MPQIEGLYVVEFGDVAIGGQTYTYWNGGVAVLEANRIFGGDSGYYYVGNYTIKDSQFEATVKIVKHNPTWEDAFGRYCLPSVPLPSCCGRTCAPTRRGCGAAPWPRRTIPARDRQRRSGRGRRASRSARRYAGRLSG